MAFVRKTVKEIRSDVDSVYAELDDHVEDINANTREILENRVMLVELQERICKLSDKIADLHSALDHVPERLFPRSIDLSVREQEVFLLLYTAGDSIRYSSLARVLSLPSGRVQELVYSLIVKGVPVVKRRDQFGDVLLSLDLEFVEAQSKENIVGIDEDISKRLNKYIQLSLFE